MRRLLALKPNPLTLETINAMMGEIKIGWPEVNFFHHLRRFLWPVKSATPKPLLVWSDIRFWKFFENWIPWPGKFPARRERKWRGVFEVSSDIAYLCIRVALSRVVAAKETRKTPIIEEDIFFGIPILPSRFTDPAIKALILEASP